MHLKQITERNEKADVEYQRNLKEHNYDLQLNRNFENDNYEQKKKALQQILTDLREQQAEAWANQEKHVKDRENDFEKLKKEAEEVTTLLSSMKMTKLGFCAGMTWLRSLGAALGQVSYLFFGRTNDKFCPQRLS